MSGNKLTVAESCLDSTPSVSDSLDSLKAGAQDELALDRSPLPFEEIPGPAVLKLWEKYWRYVPLLGTQLFRSVLINGLTEGTIAR